LNTETHDLHPEGAQAGRAFATKIYNEHADERDVRFHEQAITGRQLMQALGIHDAEANAIIKQVSSGETAEIRLDEAIDLALAENRRLWVMTSDSMQRFVLDGGQMEWPRPVIDEKVLVMLSRVRGEVEVIQELPGGGERVISSGERVNLAGAGVEHFKVRHLSKDVTVIYNEHEKSIPRGVYTTEQLKTVFQVEAGYVLDIVRGVEFVELTPGEQIRVHNGQKFFSHAPCGQSS
jgi:hypothetical protein